MQDCLNSSLFLADIDYGYDYTTNSPSSAFDVSDWLFDLPDETSKWNDILLCFHLTSQDADSYFMPPFPDACDPNPCFNGGLCQSKSDTEFICLCLKPYIGKRYQKVRNICKSVKCGHGDCVINMNQHPFYECKCRPPFQGPDCKSLPSSPCKPNPCQNGGTCMKGNRRFRSVCPDGYTGTFCEEAPSDCYVGNGDLYRGVASMTDEGHECLDWNSYFILSKGEDPFKVYADFPGLERNNHCYHWGAAHCVVGSSSLLPTASLLKRKETDSPYCAKETCFVKIACLLDHNFPAEKECVVSGWGATKKQSLSSQLLNGCVFLISDERCKILHIYGSLLDSSVLCAGILKCYIFYLLSLALQGDSGGTLVWEKNGTHYITSVVSWGEGCGQKNKPDVLTFLVLTTVALFDICVASHGTPPVKSSIQ
ncbi:hypothetical protein L3Q82_010332 [Scortum barcoo]|uniref:Uncharacterized protein n=1 Tax=Scortum barcoo TaxID=214431 RepID=A0ACB8WBY0_9TELE|nr:hypothetical protein L3Q82_010332 [Scortum barcoo]